MPPYLRTLATPPRRFNRQTYLPVAQNPTSVRNNTPAVTLNHQGLGSAMRTATRIFSFEDHRAANLPFSSTARDAQQILQFIAQGGLRKPLVVIPTDESSVFFAVGPRSTLERIAGHYNRYASIVAEQFRIVPTMQVSEAKLLAEHFENANIYTVLYEHAKKEVLLKPTVSHLFFSAKFFACSICGMHNASPQTYNRSREITRSRSYTKAPQTTVSNSSAQRVST